MRKSLRELRGGQDAGREELRLRYLKERRGYRDRCEQSKKIWQKKIEEEVREIKTEEEFWKFVNKGRRKRNQSRLKIDDELWVRHFEEQMGGKGEVEGGWKDGTTEEREEDGIWDNEITQEEVNKAIRSMGLHKAAGTDGLEPEVWKYANPEVQNSLLDLFNKIWKEGEMPVEWNEAIVVPIYKTGEKKVPKNYRGISLLCTAYKIMANVINARLTNWAETKRKLPENQMGFRKGRGTRDAVYVLHTLVEKQLAKKRGKLYAFYIDLKAAFDMIDREKLGKKLWEMGVRGKMYRMLKGIYQKTENRVRTEEGLTRKFDTGKGVRQGCPLSPLLFNLYIADLEEWLKGRQEGGVVIKGIKVWLLAYADDMVLVAEDPKQMQGMLKGLSSYLKRKGLELNYAKSKMQIFCKGGKRAKTEKWQWEGKEVEVVKAFKYLGMVMQSNNGVGEHIRYVKKKARMAMGAVWGIGERHWKGEARIREKLFGSLIEAIMTYGAEIWGWEEQRELQKLITKYWRWVLGVQWNTPGYIIQEEVNEKQLWVKTWKRAYRYDKKLRTEGRESWVNTCAKWRNEEGQKGLRWRLQRRKELAKLGISEEGIQAMEESGWEVEGEMERRINERRVYTNWTKIQNSKFNPDYKELKQGMRRAQYIDCQEIGKYEKVRLARYRTGAEHGAANYWRGQEETKCKVCGAAEETLKHVIEKCERMSNKAKEKKVGEVLREDGGGWRWLKELDKERRSKQ